MTANAGHSEFDPASWVAVFYDRNDLNGGGSNNKKDKGHFAILPAA